MCSVEYLRELISDRLTAAAGEIFTEFEKAIVQYQEEIDRQRRLLDVIWKPHVPLQPTDLPQQPKVLAEQQFSNQDRNSSMANEEPEPPYIKEEQEELCTSLDHGDPGPPLMKEEQEELCTSLDQDDLEPLQIKVEQEELCTSHEGEPLVLKQEIDTFMVTSPYEESDYSEPEPNNEQLLSHSSPFMSEAHCDADAGKKSLTCDVCGKTFQDKSKMRRHHRIHTGEKPHICNTCGKGFRHNCSLKVHMQIHTDVPQSYKVCEIEKTIVDHQLHDQERNSMVDHEDPEPPQINDQQEELCIIQEEEQLGLKQEIDTFVVTPADEESDHSEPKPNNDQLLFHNSSTAESPDQEGSKDVDSGSTQCIKLKPRHHSNNNHSSDSDTAPERQCDNDKTKKSLTCEFCGKAFGRQSGLRKHLRTHTGEKPYCCDTCGQSFSQGAHLTNHMRRHTGEKPYVCKICGKRFSESSAHNRHAAIHKEEKPFSCEVCGKCFYRRDNLVLHVRTHTGEKPYPCIVCGKSFSHNASLKIHMKRHTDEKL